MKLALKFLKASTLVGACAAFIVTSVVVGTTVRLCVNMIRYRSSES